MPIDIQAAADEYLGWLQLEANRSPNTVRAYDSEIRTPAAPDEGLVHRSVVT